MCCELEQIYKEGVKLGEERGRVRGIAEGVAVGEMKMVKEIAYELRNRGMSADKIAEVVEVSLETVQKWFADRAALAK